MKTDRYKKSLLLVLIGLSYAIYIPVLTRDFSSIHVAHFIGLVGLQLIWWQVMLGNRPINRVFTRDLFWVNRLHKTFGKYGFLIILMHPVLMVVNYGFELIWPLFDLSDRLGRGVSAGGLALSFLALIWIASAVFRGRLSWRAWKRLHLLAYIIWPLVFTHAMLIGPDLQSGWMRVWALFLAAMFVLVLLLRLLDWIGLSKMTYQVVNTSRVARDVTRFDLKPVGRGIKPRPGQFAYFQIGRSRRPHPFTISHFDKKSGVHSHSIKAVGPYSRELTKLKPGDKVFIDGPYGVFTREIEQEEYDSSSPSRQRRPTVMIAGGIGITPFIRWLEMKKIDYFFLGAQTEQDIAYKDTIEKSGAKTTYALSDQESKGYLKGFITVDLLEEKINQKLADCDFFICGPPIMMEKLSAELKRKGVPSHHIYTERFSL